MSQKTKAFKSFAFVTDTEEDKLKAPVLSTERKGCSLKVTEAYSTPQKTFKQNKRVLLSES